MSGVCVKEPDGQVWVQGGSLLMAHGGVCVLGDFSTFRKDVRQAVCRGNIYTSSGISNLLDCLVSNIITG